MILLEFAAQGVRGVAPAGGRATLRPGYNVVAADGPALRRLLEALLYPSARDGDSLPRATGGPAGAPVRAGLTLVGNDRVTYRLVRDFAAGAQLHRFDAEKRAFALVSQDLPAIAEFLQRTAGVPPPGRFAALLSLAAAELPSRQGGPSLGGGAALPPQRQALSPAEAQRKLGPLRAELERAKIAEKLQAQQDELQTQAFKLEEVLKVGGKLREAVERAEQSRAELEPVAKVAAGLGDPGARLAAYEKATARREEAQARVAAEREGLAAAEAAGVPGPFWRDPLFLGAVGAGLGFVLLGAGLGAVAPGFRYVMLLDIPAFGAGAYVALRWVGSLEERERGARRRRVVDDWEQKVQAQYQRDGTEVREALAALAVGKVSELKDLFARLAEADAALEAARRALVEWEAQPEAARATAEQARIQEEQRACEARMAKEVEGFVRDPRSIEMEIQRLEADAERPAAAAPVPAPAPTRPAAGAGVEPLRGLLERAAAELGGSTAAAGRAAAAKASQALSGFTFQRLSAVQVDDRGGVHAVTGGRPVPALTLPPADRDLVFVALKLALLEQALAVGRTVAVLEDAFPGLSEGARRFAARLLKQLARPGQVVHATTDPSFREAADHSA
ncbi:MAG TPA: hypothetical protein VML50_00010 [Anaeromyxobacter sp.]|nr:hypothetical protein [Anaeromyxobacter sp.]